MTNLVLNLRNAKAQAGCAKSSNRKSISPSFRKGLGVGLLSLLLLTLGVGQMWATDYYYRGDKNSWGATKMTAHNSGLYAYYSTSAQSFNGDKFKIALTTSSWNYNYSYVAKSFNGGSANIGDYSSDNCYIWDSNNGYILVYYPNTAVNTTSNPKISFRTSLYVPTFYIKHPFADGSTWSWGTMTRTGTGTYTYTGNCYTASGANVYMSKSDNNYLSPSGTSGVNNGVPAVWTYNSTANTLSVAPAYTLTVNSGGNGTATGSVSKGIKMSTAYSISATPSGGYRFKNWTVTSGTASFGSSTSASTTVTVTGSASAVIQANFEEIPGGTITLTAETGGKVSNDNSSWGSSATISGITTATDKNIYAQANSGYTFNTWTKTSGSGTIKTNAASGVFTTVAGADAALTASFTENMRSVTISVSPSGAGTLNKTSASVGVATTTTVTATAQPGYRFTGWTATNCNVASTSSASTTLSGNGSSGSGTLVANFSRTYAYVQGRMTVYNSARNSETHTASSKGGWDENSTRIAMDYDATNHWFYRHTYKTPAELKAQISSNDQWFSIARSNNSGSWSGKTTYHPSSNQDLTTTGSANKKAAQTSTTTYNYKFNSSTTTGYAILYFDEAGVWYELEHTLKYNANNGSGSAPAATTYYNHGVNATAASNTYTRSGYTFNGWNTAANGSGSSYAAGASVPMNSNITLYAQWTPVTYTISFSQSGTGYASGGQTADMTATYGAAMPTPISIPTAANGYAFMGYYDALEPLGTQYYTSTGASARNWNKTTAATLYAYFKKAEITAITLNHDAFEPTPEATGDNDKDYVTATPTITPTPAGTTKVCWEMLYDNDNPVPSGHDPVTVSGNTVKFSIVGLSPGSYKIKATLRTGSSCDGGTVLNTFTKSFTIASDFTVTIQYKCGDAVIKASTTNPGKPLEGTSITAPNIIGYTFSKWKAGDGVTISGADANGEKASATITYTANYDGVLTAIYTQKRMIYFYNTLGWSNVYVYFYKNDSYWENTGENRGSGANTTFTWTNTPYSEGKHGQMQPIAPGSNIYYFDVEAAGVNASYVDVVFTEANQHGYDYFYQTKAARRGDYKSTLPMFVPIDKKTETKNQTDYYSNGYWMNYPENTGYTLRIYNDPYANNSTGAIHEYPFPYSEDLKMPWKYDVEFNFTGEAWFMIYRNDGQLLGKSYNMNQNWHETELDTGSDQKIHIQTSAEGVYKFTLSFPNVGTEESPNYKYYVYVEYPVSIGDYRIKYNDRASWSGSAHTASWWHASDIIRKNTGSEAKSDTVSLYVAYGSASPGPSAKFQKVTAINESTGVVTWSDVASGTVSLAGISKKGVYNFIVTQPAGGASISLTKTEPYDGNYYIRTDNAGSTKWDNFRTRDHQMTYTEFSMSDANSFGDKYSHYFASWCERGTNIKFCIANDYSSCISDTLAQDVGDPYKNTDSGGTLKSDGAGLPINDKYSANVRFMYNEETNKISRAYVGSSTNPERKFLILEGNQVLKGDDDETITDWSPKKALILQDDQNWIYERVLKILPGTRFKLYSCYAQKSVESDSAQYFRGTYDSDRFTNDDNSVILIDGSGGYQMARIIYDFKTNRLIAAWIPSGSDVSGNMAINADVLVEREHQEAAQYITFATESSKLSKVKTVYGAMKFNRWILNNRSGSADHEPDHGKTAEQLSTYHPPLAVGDQKSIYERSLYFISFPFDVKVSEIFGFGHYWDEWYLEYYDGLNRAKNGYWMDSPPNWKYVTPAMADTMVLRAYQGYILGLDLDFMQADNFTFWSNGITTIELFFPSTVEQDVLEAKNVTIPALPSTYECTINRGTAEGDRRVKDSYWRCIGVPSFNIYNSALTDASGEITWKTDYTWYSDKREFPFIYMWNRADNTLTPQSTNRFTFLPMHAYLVQNGKQINWTNVSAATPSVVARRENDMPATEYEWRLEIAKDSQLVDQTYIRMSNLEQVTDTFDFGQDLIKELNNPRSNIYSYIGYERVAANSMTLHTDSMTVIPIGVNIVTAGDYTFAMPDGTDGVGITLIDSETGTRTNLGAGMTYTLTLAKGDYNNRLFLEISPVKETPTGLEPSVVSDQPSAVRKVLIDDILYIIRDGRIYDARGAIVE